MEFLLIYLYVVATNIVAMSGSLMGVCLTVGGMLFVINLTFIPMVRADNMHDEDAIKAIDRVYVQIGRGIKICVISAVLTLFFVFFTPSVKQLGWIVGGGVAWNISQTEEAKKLPDNVLKTLNSFLEGVYEETGNVKDQPQD